MDEEDVDTDDDVDIRQNRNKHTKLVGDIELCMVKAGELCEAGDYEYYS